MLPRLLHTQSNLCTSKVSSIYLKYTTRLYKTHPIESPTSAEPGSTGPRHDQPTCLAQGQPALQAHKTKLPNTDKLRLATSNTRLLQRELYKASGVHHSWYALWRSYNRNMQAENYGLSSFTGTTHQDFRPSSTSTSGEPHDVDWTGHALICLLESEDPKTLLVAYCSTSCLANLLQGCPLRIPILFHLNCEQIETQRLYLKSYYSQDMLIRCLDTSQVDELHPS